MSLLNILTLGKYQENKERKHVRKLEYELNTDNIFHDVMNLVTKTIKHSVMEEMKTNKTGRIEKKYSLNEEWEVEFFINGTYSRIMISAFSHNYMCGELFRYQNGQWYTLGLWALPGRSIHLNHKWDKYLNIFDELIKWTDLCISKNYLSKEDYQTNENMYFERLLCLID